MAKTFNKDMRDLLTGFQAEQDWQLERLEDVETLTDIIREHRVNGARSNDIANAIIRFVKKGEG